MHHELPLLVLGLDGNEQDVRAGSGLADRGGIGSVVLAAPACAAIGRHELGGDQAHGVAELAELAGPVVGTGARFHGVDARWQRSDQLEQLGARHRRTQQFGAALLVASMDGKHVLGEIDADGQNGHGLPLPKELMRFATPSWHSSSSRCGAAGLGREGEVRFVGRQNQRPWARPARTRPRPREEYARPLVFGGA